MCRLYLYIKVVFNNWTLFEMFSEHMEGEIDAKFLREKMPAANVDVDRISTGSRYIFFILFRFKFLSIGWSILKEYFKESKLYKDLLSCIL